MRIEYYLRDRMRIEYYQIIRVGGHHLLFATAAYNTTAHDTTEECRCRRVQFSHV